MHGSIKESIKNILLSILACCLIFLVLEISYRFYKHIKYHEGIKRSYPLIKFLGPRDRLEYTLQPDSEFTLKNGVIYKINSKGLRDREFNYKKTLGVRRILALGDSFTFGWHEKRENTYPKLLERALNKDSESGKFEVINAGVYGYNTEQEYEFLKKELIKYSPDLVILGFTQNDAEPQNTVPRSPYFEMEGVRVWLWELIKYKINVVLAKFGIHDFFIIHKKEARAHEWEAFQDGPYEWKKGACFNALKNIKQLLDERHISLLVTIFPSLDYGSPPYEKYIFKIIDDSLKDFCEKENIEVLDLYPLFEGKNTETVTQKSWHLNKKGYLMAAEAIAGFVQ